MNLLINKKLSIADVLNTYAASHPDPENQLWLDRILEQRISKSWFQMESLDRFQLKRILMGQKPGDKRLLELIQLTFPNIKKMQHGIH